ncbi:DUF1818 family protein [Oscillatoriales cyanobacterium LEGE 11467]|uniref:DUF1818 family protein n=1 Tax=Zarconia navalis LEGE 11467 TaxID=1828826 RepID=A0A928Z7X7_9CYAN|nr:DUF1818 family protein [Zarconia navalis]MBE9039236.1 DUF1818 family protein [Zarconia navalis LEGE 11467]
MNRIVKSDSGWRLGWDAAASEFKGLVGTDDWAFELREDEFQDFCRLFDRLATTMSQMRSELMDEEKITCEAQSDRLWLEVEGYPDAYSLRLILNTGRRCEGEWLPEAVPGLLQAARTIAVF